MPNRPHHTDKMKRCVEEVMGKGHDESSAYAICTTSMQKAGEPIFEAAASRSPKEYALTRLLNMRTCKVSRVGERWQVQTADGLKTLGTYDCEEEALAKEEAVQKELYRLSTNEEAPDVQLHLCGALGKSRVETLNGIEHLVVPIIALMEGVIHPVNAETPEFVPVETIRRMAASFNGRPVVVGHPVKNGRQCSANEPEIVESVGIGTIYNSRVEGRKLHMDAWIEKPKAQRLYPELFRRLSANEVEEVSVGAYVVADPASGTFNGRAYKARWKDGHGDHLALLPNGRGACSVEMGCGACRAAEAYDVTDDGFRAASFAEPTLTAAIGKRNNADDALSIQQMHDLAVKLGAACDRHNYKMMEGDPKPT